MPDPTIVNPAIIQQFLLEDHSVKSINQKLLELGYDEDTILKYVAEFKKIKNGRRRMKGMICLVVGAFLGFVSCVLALTDPIPELHDWFLFGLTSIAILLASYGLYNIFE